MPFLLEKSLDLQLQRVGSIFQSRFVNVKRFWAIFFKSIFRYCPKGRNLMYVSNAERRPECNINSQLRRP